MIRLHGYARDHYICVSRRRREMYIGHARLCVCVCMSVCLSACMTVCPQPHANTTMPTPMIRLVTPVTMYV